MSRVVGFMWPGEFAVDLREVRLPIGMEVDTAMVRLLQLIASVHGVQ
jgi:hypothetical protein